MASQEISNLEIVIKDNATQAATSVKNLADALGMLKRNGASLEKIASSVASINKASNTSGIKKATVAIDEMSSKATKMATNINQANKSFSSLGKSSGISQATKELDRYQKILNQIDLQSSLGKWANESLTPFQKVSNEVKSFGNTVKTVLGRTVPKFITNTLKQMNRMMRMRLLRTAVKAILSGITEGLQNLYQWSLITGNGFASVMDSMATNSLYLKNTIGAAFGQLLTTISPIITTIVDIIVTAIDYVNMFFAILNGQTTYTRAKRNAVEWASAASGAVGGVTGSVKELQEELSVLDFDELNQLQEQSTPSSGGGGGGGSGSPGKNYSDMFETVEIPQNAVTNVMGEIAKNFDAIATAVAAIGGAIWGWKISNEFAKTLGTLTGLKAGLGITFMVTGSVLLFSGAYDLGKNGVTLLGIAKTVFGSGLLVGGSILTFGTAGLMLSIPLSIAIATAGFIFGRADANKQAFHDTEGYKALQKELDDSFKELEKVRDITVRVGDIKLEYESRTSDINVAQELVNQLSAYNGIENPTQNQLKEIQNLVGALNSMNLDGLNATFDVINGKVSLNITELQGAINKLKEYAQQQALFDLMVEQTRLTIEVSQIEIKYKNAKDTMMSAAEDYVTQMLNDKANGLYVSRQWSVGMEVPTLQWALNPALAEKMDTLNVAYENAKNYADALSNGKAQLDEINELVGILNDQMTTAADGAKAFVGSLKFNSAAGDVAQITGQKYNETDGFNAQPYQNITPMSFVNPVQLQKGITKSGSQGLSIYADATKNAVQQTKDFVVMVGGIPYTVKGVRTQEEALAQITEQLGRTQEETSQKMSGHQASLKGFSGTVDLTTKSTGNLTKGLQQIGTGMNLPKVRTNIQTELKPSLFNSTGTGIQSAIQTPVNAITANGKTVFNNINGAITAQQFNKPGEAVQKAIQTPINAITASGKKIFSNIKGNILDSSNNYGGIGGTMQSAMQGKVNATTANGKVIHKNIKNAINEYDYGGIGTDISKQINNNLNITKDFSSIPDILISSFKTSLDGFWKVGSSVGSQIKQGIINEVGNLNFITTATAGSTTQKLTGKITTQLYGLGGFPEMGELFIANEMGAEMVGRIGNKTAVANNDQIATALARALQPMLGGGGGTQTTNVTVEMDSATIAKASYRGRTALNKQYNMRVSG